MYKSNFVCSLKVGGKILREKSGEVALPFGSEYSILLKNLHSRRAMVKVSVDGQDATEGTKLILQPNDTLELERFIRNGNLKSGNRFKFIERTSEIEEHRGIKVDDGLIRAEFWVERETIDVPRKRYYDEWIPYYRYYPWYVPYSQPYPSQPSIPWTCNSGGLSGGNVGAANCSSSLGDGLQKSVITRSASNFQGAQAQIMCASMNSANEAGITVPGSQSDQQFRSSYGFETESQSHVIVLQLKGFFGGLPVEVPVTVDRKAICDTCGRKNKASSSFCSNCGTALKLI